MPKYDFTLFDGTCDEWAEVEAGIQPRPTGLSVQERKTMINQEREEISAKAMRILARQVTMQDYKIPTADGSIISARTYESIRATGTPRSSLPLYIHLHGGGFLFGTLSSEDAICSRIALGADVVVLNVEYRHTPEFKYPCAWDDAEYALQWVNNNIEELKVDPEKIVLGGISAGAQIAASVTLGQHLGLLPTSLPRIAGEVLMIPCLVNADCYGPQLEKIEDPTHSSLVVNEHAPILPMTAARFFTDLLDVRQPRPDDLKLNPGNATVDQVKGLPPTVMGIAGRDPLRDEGLLYANLLTEAGVPINVHLFKGLPHGFRRYGDKLSASKVWDNVMVDGITWILSKPRPSSSLQIKT